MKTPLTILVVACAFQALYAQAVLKVSIYYESLCSDSVDFIVNQLYPCYSKNSKYLQVDFVPYGKVNVSLVNGSNFYACQHGKEECYGNRMQACALYQTQDQNTHVEFVNCAMSKTNPASRSSLFECAEAVGLSWEAIETCESLGQGDRLFAYYGYRTQIALPNIKFVPTIIFNDRYDEVLQKKALADFCPTTTKIIRYLISNTRPYPWCKCPDLSPRLPSHCCHVNPCSICPWTSGCSGCNTYGGNLYYGGGRSYYGGGGQSSPYTYWG